MEPQHDPQSSEELPDVLQGALRRLGPNPAPHGLDRAVLAAAGAVLARERARRRRRITWLAVPLGAAAAAVLLVLARRQPLAERSSAHGVAPGQVVQAEDLDRNGRVDILDAFQLARELEGGRTLAHRDFSGDGRVDRADVERLAQLAVRVGT